MQRSGQCKCGAILKFEQGPAGFKGRCPQCGAVVRLRVPTDGPPPPPAAQGGRGRPPRPSDPRLSVVALRTPGPAVPGEPDADATAPFEPVAEVVLEPWNEPQTGASPSFLKQYRIALVVGAIALIAGGAGASIVFWLWFS
jgi:hypothetical protein